MKYDLDYAILGMIDNAIRTVKAAPLVLGATASGGGGPVGGFIGYLPQTRVSFDPIEAAIWDVPESGMSLLTNMDRIRYRLGILESGTFLDLDDTPVTYSGYAGQTVIVNPTEDGLVFGEALPPLDGDRVVITDSSGTLSTDSSFLWDAVNKLLMLGGNLADIIPSTALTDAIVGIAENIARSIAFFVYGPDYGGEILFVRGRGTKAAPTAITTGDSIGKLVAKGYTDDDTMSDVAGEVRIIADDTWTTTSTPTGFTVWLTRAGGTVLQKVFAIKNNGTIQQGDGTFNITGNNNFIQESDYNENTRRTQFLIGSNTALTDRDLTIRGLGPDKSTIEHLTANILIKTIAGRGYHTDGAGFSSTDPIKIVFRTENEWSSTDESTQMWFHVTPSGVSSTGNIAALKITGSGIHLPTVGEAMYIKEGTNAAMGTATLSAGSVVVSTTKVTNNSRIFLTVQSLGTVTTPKAIGVTARTAGTSFTITSSDNTDTSVVAWMIVEAL